MSAGKFLTWRVGDVNITRVAEMGDDPFPRTFMFPAATPELVRRSTADAMARNGDSGPVGVSAPPATAANARTSGGTWIYLAGIVLLIVRILTSAGANR